jgi:hypothetical protein
LIGREYHTARQNAYTSPTFRLTEFILCQTSFMPLSQAALRTALVRAMAFAHHKAQEKTAPRHQSGLGANAAPERDRQEAGPDRANQ